MVPSESDIREKSLLTMLERSSTRLKNYKIFSSFLLCVRSYQSAFGIIKDLGLCSINFVVANTVKNRKLHASKRARTKNTLSALHKHTRRRARFTRVNSRINDIAVCIVVTIKWYCLQWYLRLPHSTHTTPIQYRKVFYLTPPNEEREFAMNGYSP